MLGSAGHVADRWATLQTVKTVLFTVNDTSEFSGAAQAAFDRAGATGYVPAMYADCGDAFFAAGSIDTARRLWTTALTEHQQNRNEDGDAAKALADKLSRLP